MNQQRFQELHGAQWQEFEAWLDGMASKRRRETQPPPFGESDLPHRYRTLCQHLALARDRQYSPALVERLNRLVIRGHQFMYGSHPEAGPAVMRFFTEDFARAVRRHWRVVALSALLFFGPLFLFGALTRADGDIAHMLIPAEQIAAYERMYDERPDRTQRAASIDAYMFGHYIWNNVRIGFQTFAGGLLFGVGSAFFLGSNGVIIGATAGYLIGSGRGPNFLAFVSGHSALELGGIVLMGAGGLMLGAALLFPGRSARISALRANARAAVPLVYGAGAMLTLAAFVEAFWSPLAGVAPPFKYGIGVLLWVLVIAYFVLAGRRRAA
jgi:uncharacterized membrane protein SpoIIM required for sporulation